MDLDVVGILEKILVVLVSGAIGWLFKTVLRLRRDMNCAFHKIRNGPYSQPMKNGEREYPEDQEDG